MTNLDDRLRDAAASLQPTEAPIPPFAGVRQRARRRHALGAVGAAVVAAAVAFAGVSATRGDDKVIVQKSGPTSTPTTLEPTTTTTTTTVPAPVGETTRVTVYLIANEHLVAVSQQVIGPVTPEAAVRALLAAPDGTTEQFGESAIPAGTVLNSLSVDGSVATVDLSAQFTSGGGSLSMEARVAQVVFTVTQFAPLDEVRFRIDGVPVSTIGGEGLKVDNVTRADFADVTPLILVELPTPLETVHAPVHVSGISNTFEATVNYTLTDVNGAVLYEGVTMATTGNGLWGDFDFDIPFTPDHAGPVQLHVFEYSAKDGSVVHETIVPLELEP